MTGIWTLKFLSTKIWAKIWTMKIERFVLCQHLWKICVQRVKILFPSLKKKSQNPLQKHVILYYRERGVGGGGGLQIKNGTSLWNHSHPLICCAIFSAALRPCQVLLGLLEYLAVVLVQGVIGIFNVKQTGSSESSKNAQDMGKGQCGGYPLNLSFTLEQAKFPIPWEPYT